MACLVAASFQVLHHGLLGLLLGKLGGCSVSTATSALEQAAIHIMEGTNITQTVSCAMEHIPAVWLADHALGNPEYAAGQAAGCA